MKILEWTKHYRKKSSYLERSLKVEKSLEYGMCKGAFCGKLIRKGQFDVEGTKNNVRSIVLNCVITFFSFIFQNTL